MSLTALISTGLATRRKHNIALLTQLRQIVALRFGPGLLGPWEYYFFEVFFDMNNGWSCTQDKPFRKVASLGAYFWGGMLGRTSTLLGSVRAGMRSKSTTICPISSG